MRAECNEDASGQCTMKTVLLGHSILDGAPEVALLEGGADRSSVDGRIVVNQCLFRGCLRWEGMCALPRLAVEEVRYVLHVLQSLEGVIHHFVVSPLASIRTLWIWNPI